MRTGPRRQLRGSLLLCPLREAAAESALPRENQLACCRHEATHELVHLDGKIVHTLRLLVTKPGELTREFFAGRRARYIGPIRLYLTFSLLFFLCVSLFAGRLQFQLRQVPESPVATEPAPSADVSFVEKQRRSLRAKLDDLARKGRAHPEKVQEAFVRGAPRGTFLLVPCFALLTWAFYRRQQRYYVPHFYYALHFHSFAFLLLSVVAFLPQLGLVGRLLAQSSSLWLLAYHFIGLAGCSEARCCSPP